MRRPILFLHIPRTGGMSLRNMGLEVFGWERSRPDVHLVDANVTDLSNADFVEGHVDAAFFARMGDAWPANGYTLLREPVARTVSQAIHLRTRARHPQETRDPQALFEQLPMLGNTQTKLLGGGDLDAARALLDQLAFGLTEQFSVSVALFCARFDVAFPDLLRTNASPRGGHDDLRSDEFRAAVRAHNDLDVQLFAYAAARFRERLDAHNREWLALAADEASTRLALDTPIPGSAGAVFLPRGAGAVDVRGGLLLAGKPAEAVFVRAGGVLTPVGCRFLSERLAEESRDPEQRFAGLRGLVAVPDDATALEFLAFDRTRRLRGEVRIELVRSERAVPAHTPSATNVGRRAERARLQRELLESAGLRPSSHVLEIGRGEPWLAQELEAFLDGRGVYAGFDANARPGRRRGFHLPYADNTFDVVCAFEGFTRVSLPQLRARLTEAARVVRDHGVGVFMINARAPGEPRPIRITGREFAPVGDGVYDGFPEARDKHALAFDEPALVRILSESGWTLANRLAGSWHESAGRHRTSAPFHGSDVCICLPAPG